MIKNNVKFVCYCKTSYNLTELFFCDECSRICCERCTDVDIEAYACPNCCTDFSLHTAMQSKFCCARCMCCPLCSLALSLRDDAGKYLFVCSFCRWQSMDVGIHASSVNDLFSLVFHQQHQSTHALEQLASEKIAELRRTWLTNDEKKNYLLPLNTDDARAFPIASLVSSSYTSNELPQSIKRMENQIDKRRRFHRDIANGVSPAIWDEKTDETLQLIRDVWRGKIHHSLVADAEQHRHAVLIASTHTLITEYIPHPMRLQARISHRCRNCHKLLVKQPMQPRCADFQILALAQDFLPSLCISNAPKHIVCGHQYRIVVNFCNPRHYDVTVKLLSSQDTIESEDKVILKPNHSFTLFAFNPVLAHRASLVRDKPKLRDDDDPDIIVFRSANEVGVAFEVLSSHNKHIRCSLMVEVMAMDAERNQDLLRVQFAARIIVSNDE